MDKFINFLGEVTVISKLHANSGYWQVRVAEEDLDKTSFTSHHGSFYFTHMPSRMKNTCMTFQRAIRVLLTKNKRQYAVFHSDDTVIFLHSPIKHIEHVKQVLKILSNTGMTFNLKKCNVFQTALIILVMSFSLGSFRFPQEQLTP